MADGATLRLAVRVLIIDAFDRLLLLHAALPNGRSLWLPPGGGLEPGETQEQSAVREVQEETGILLDALGPRVWTRRAPNFEFDQSDLFFLARVEGTPVVRDRDNPDPIEVAAHRGHRWWSHPEIVAASDTLFVPRTLGAHLAPLLAGIIPVEPFDVGI